MEKTSYGEVVRSYMSKHRLQNLLESSVGQYQSRVEVVMSLTRLTRLRAKLHPQASSLFRFLGALRTRASQILSHPAKTSI